MLTNKKTLQGRSGGPYSPRVYHRKARGKMSNRLLVKCGDCDKAVQIYYDREELEINGVLASVKDWRAILLPLIERRPK